MKIRFEYIDDNFKHREDLRESMFKLRYAIFVQQLNWACGHHLSGNLEYDEYDNSNAKYIVGIDSSMTVQASCRLIPTNCHYLIADKYPESAGACSLPKTDKIYEISRFCLSYKLRKASNGKAMGWLLAEAMKTGIALKLTHFISLTTDTVIPAIEKYSGWTPIYLGPKIKTENDSSYALLFEVNQHSIDNTYLKSEL